MLAAWVLGGLAVLGSAFADQPALYPGSISDQDIELYDRELRRKNLRDWRVSLADQYNTLLNQIMAFDAISDDEDGRKSEIPLATKKRLRAVRSTPQQDAHRTRRPVGPEGPGSA